MTESIFPETIYGIKVPNRMNPDAALALDGWLHGYLNGRDIVKVVDKNDVYYYVYSERAIDASMLSSLIRYLEGYLEPDDPRPTLAIFRRSKEYTYAGTEVGCE